MFAHVFCSVFFRRMFPHCKVNLSGLIPCAKYILLVDMVPEDGFRYKVRQQCFVLRHFPSSVLLSGYHISPDKTPPVCHPPSADIVHQRLLSLPVFLSPAGSPLYYPLSLWVVPASRHSPLYRPLLTLWERSYL